MNLKWICYLLLVSSCAAATGLPPEHESRRLLIAAKSNVNAGHWEKARRQLQSMQKLGVELPNEFYFLNGKLLQHDQKLPQAREQFETYVVKAGTEAENYELALTLITQIEDFQQDKKNVPEKQASPEIDRKAVDGYIKSLEALYLTDDPVKALLLQVNSLLSANAYTGTRVHQMDQRRGIRYSLAVSGNNLVLQEKKFDPKGPKLKVVKQDVSGIDPFIRFGCDYKAFQCWLYHPVQRHQHWIIVDKDELAARELSEAMSKLIQFLQKRNSPAEN